MFYHCEVEETRFLILQIQSLTPAFHFIASLSWMAVVCRLLLVTLCYDNLYPDVTSPHFIHLEFSNLLYVQPLKNLNMSGSVPASDTKAREAEAEVEAKPAASLAITLLS